MFVLFNVNMVGVGLSYAGVASLLQFCTVLTHNNFCEIVDPSYDVSFLVVAKITVTFIKRCIHMYINKAQLIWIHIKFKFYNIFLNLQCLNMDPYVLNKIQLKPISKKRVNLFNLFCSSRIYSLYFNIFQIQLMAFPSTN